MKKSAAIPAISLLILLSGFLDFCPGIAQCCRPIEYELFSGAVGIDTEITQSLELVSLGRFSISQGRLNTT